LGDNLAFNCVCLADSIDKKILLSVDWDGEIKKWDFPKKKLIGSMEKREQISSFICSNDDKFLFEGDNFGKMYQIDLEDDKTKGEWKIHNKRITAMARLRELGHIFTCDMEGSVKEWHIEKSKVLKDWGEVVEGDDKKVHKHAIEAITVANLHSDPKGEPF